MISYIPSFYLLQRISRDSWSGQDAARSALEQLADSMALCFRDYLFMASLGESRHALRRIGQGFEGFEDRERDSIFKEAKRFAISPENVKSLIDLFDLPNWGKNPGYGGAKWAELARLVAQYDKLSPIMYVDAVVNAHHNGGTAFSKTESDRYIDIDFTLDFSMLRQFLDFRRESPDILQEFTVYFKRVSLTSGKLAIAHRAECHSGLATTSLVPIPDHVYKKFNWGKLSLPKLINKGRTCHACSKVFTSTKTCSNCGYAYCYEHYGDIDEDECDKCQGKGDKNTRCPVCLGRLGSQIIKTSCGLVIHKSCASFHRVQCAECYHKIDVKKYVYDYSLCSVCHMPMTDYDEEWHTYAGYGNPSKLCHKHCYWLVSDKSVLGDYNSSKKLFGEIAELCSICKLPVLRGHTYGPPDCDHYETEFKFHRHCAELHRITCKDCHVCDCSDCKPVYNVWRQIKKEIDHVKEE